MNPWLVPLILLILLSGSAFIPGHLPEVDTTALNSGDTAWMLTASGLVLLMTPGLSLFYAGMVSSKNIISTMLQSFICLGVVSLLWVLCGFSLAFGDSAWGILGDPRLAQTPRHLCQACEHFAFGHPIAWRGAQVGIGLLFRSKIVRSVFTTAAPIGRPPVVKLVDHLRLIQRQTPSARL